MVPAHDSDRPGRSSSRPRLRSIFVFVLLVTVAWWLLLRVTGRRITQADVHPADLARVEPPAPAVLDSPSEAFPMPGSGTPPNLILFVADGLGFSHLAAARAALHGIDGSATWDRLPVVGWHRPHPIDGLLTDSAASATALATGQATLNGAVAVDADGQPLATLFERATTAGYRSAIVTDSYVWDATPAAFATHVNDRDDAAGILQQLATANLDVLFGELEDVGEGAVPPWEDTVTLLSARYEVLGPEPVTIEELLAPSPGQPVAALFEEDQVTDLDSAPNLQTMTRAALARMEALATPFVLLVESEELDSASHRRDLERVLKGVEAIEATLTDLIDYAERHGETLLVFTSDHETGALSVSTVKGNRTLKALWGSDSHTGSAVPLMALGPGAQRFAGSHANWEVGRLLSGWLEAAARQAEVASEEPAP